MKTFQVVGRLIVGLVLVLGVMSVAAPSTNAAANTGRIYIHVLKCSSHTYDVYGQCHDRRVQGAQFRVSGVSRVSNANGTISWGPSAGTRSIVFETTPISPYKGSYVYCRDLTTDYVLYDGRNQSGVVTVHTVAGHLTHCDWYILT